MSVSSKTTNKTTILHVIPIFATGGAERLVLHYAKLLDHSRFDIHVASCVEDGELRTQFDALSSVSVYVGSRTGQGGRIAVYRALRQYVREIQPRIIHTHLLSADVFGYVMKRLYGDRVSWVSTLHNVEHETSWVRRMVWRHILRRADRVIAVSRSVEVYARTHFHLPPTLIITLLNGIETSVWKRIPLSRAWTHDVVRIACIGRLWEQKGHRYLIDALSELKNTEMQYEVHFFGDGPLRAELQAYARTQGVWDMIVWRGVVSDVHRHSADIDIVVQPSLWEGLSLVVMEMMTAGRVVITTPAGGEELIEHGVSGYIVPPKDGRALAECIAYVSTHRDEACRVAREARTRASASYDIADNVRQLTDVYTDVWST